MTQDNLNNDIDVMKESIQEIHFDYHNSLPRAKHAYSLSVANRITFWFSKHYLMIFNLIAFLYMGIPFLAPVLMKADLKIPAKVIYIVYSPLCHQLGFRSFYLFGEQAYYPRSLANIPDMLTYENITKNDTINIYQARGFIGDEIVGYKIAICQRCLAIYGTMLMFGIFFDLSGRRLKPIPWYIWFLIGLVPLGLDGVSQLPSLTGGVLPAWLPSRESTPFYRVITGGLFGLTTVWYLYPYIEESMIETRNLLMKKIVVSNGTSDLETTKNDL